MKAYLAAPIFTERDRNFNSYLEREILKRCPDLDLYLAQNNASINDKTGCANSADIYVGDVTRLKQADLLISIMSADVPPIGSSYETSYFCGLCEADERRQIIALYDDCRDGSKTYSEAKRQAMLAGNAENQWPYINLLAVGYVKKHGAIYFTSAELINAVEKAYKVFNDTRTSGIYKITNLHNNLIYIGQTHDFHQRWLSHKRDYKTNNSPLYEDMRELGMEYFKFEIIEKCNTAQLDEREKYWIEYYDSYFQGYNQDTGGSGHKSGENYETAQTVKVYSYTLDGKFDKCYNSMAAAMRDLHQKSNNILRVIQANDNKHKAAERMWRLQYFPCIPAYESPVHGKQIFAYDLTTREFVAAYDNMTAAGIALTGKRQPHIVDVANGKRKSCCGFIWSYNKYDLLPADYWNDEAMWHQYDINTREWIACYKTLNNAAQACGHTDGAHICDVTNGFRNTAFGYLWAREKFEILPVNYYEK